MQQLPGSHRQQSEAKTAANLKNGANLKAIPPSTVTAEKTTTAKTADIVETHTHNDSRPVYLPLPLTTDLFPNALFFIRKYTGGSKSAAKNSTGVFIELHTFHLGTLWVALEVLSANSLAVRFAAENQAARQKVEQILPELKEELKQAGYSRAALHCFVNSKVRCCQDIDPAAGGAQLTVNLMDCEV